MATSGLTIKLAGKGMPQHNFPSQKGDMYVTFEVDFPASLSDEQKKAFEDLL